MQCYNLISMMMANINTVVIMSRAVTPANDPFLTMGVRLAFHLRFTRPFHVNPIILQPPVVDL